MDLNEYIRQSYKRPNRKVLEGLGASEELIEYLMETPWNTNMKVVESLTSKGSGDDKPGIKSITISPALETTPSLDSLFPFYWDEAQAEDGWQAFEQVLATNTSLTEGTKYTVTVTPTSEWIVWHEEQQSEVGKPFTYEVPVKAKEIMINLIVGTEVENKGVEVLLKVRE